MIESVESVGIFAGMIGLIEVIKMLINKLGKKESILTEKERYQIHSLYDMHSKTDQDGTPLWYVPRDFMPMQTKMLDILKEMAHSQERTTEILDRLMSRLDK